MTPHDLHARAVDTLLARRAPDGHWEGRLSSSALSTATAVGALGLYQRAGGGPEAAEDGRLVERGVRWLTVHANADGGWGDTLDSASNISTTLLAWAALAFADEHDGEALSASRRAEAWLAAAAGGLDAGRLSAAVESRYGRDRTFSVPILTMCALAGRLGPAAEAWREIRALPFELAAAPRFLFAWLRLPVVSYALPALIAMGLARHRRRPTRNPVLRLVREAATARVLRVLTALQPSNGGFLEATPLTSFVAMSLVGAGERAHPAVGRALGFIRNSVRDDGSWPIDTHLATWVTTLAVNALHDGGGLERLGEAERLELARWLAEQQHSRGHVYTGAPPGGWAWTPRPGGVPDADDSAGAIVALAALHPGIEGRRAAAGGIDWLLALQNRDGGIPTFCRGWGALPFDRSSPDLTAHAVRAWTAWLQDLDRPLRTRVERALGRALDYLRRAQRADGAFLPLWFGNEAAPGEANPTYGTARVLTALAAAGRRRDDVREVMGRAAGWLLAARHGDGSWGGDRGVRPSVEETALAIGALADFRRAGGELEGLGDAILAGCRWLADETRDGTRFVARPIGLYFARLWYSEALYPIVFTVDGVGRAAKLVGTTQLPTPQLPTPKPRLPTSK